MIYILYILLVPISLIITVISIPLSIILPLFAQQKLWWCDNHSYQAVGPVLPFWLNWFMTPDNTLNGDATFQTINDISYWSKVKWLLRNPAYSFAIRYLYTPYTTKVLGDPTIKDNDNAKAGWCFVKANGLFQFTWIAYIGFSRCMRFTGGWNIMALVDPNVVFKPETYQATFAFSPRLSGFR